MLIFPWHIPEAFVLRKKLMLLLISVAPSCCVAGAPHQPGESQEVCRFRSSAFLLKLDPEARNGMEVPTKQLSLKCLHCCPLRETWRIAESVLCAVCHYFYECNCISFSDGGVMFWVYLGFLLFLFYFLFSFYFYESSNCSLRISSTDCLCMVCLQYFQQRI